MSRARDTRSSSRIVLTTASPAAQAAEWADIGMPVLKEAGTLGNGIVHLSAAQHRPDRLVACAQTLGDCQDIGRDPLLRTREQMPGSSHAAHHFVEDQEHAILVAYLADALEISLDRGHGAERGADDRLRDEGHHAVRAQAKDLRFQLVRDPPAVVMGALVRGPFGILVARRNVTDLDQHRFELGATPLIAAGSQSAKRVAVIALSACDQMATLRFAALEVVLSGQLESRFDGFGAAGDEIDPVEIFRRMSDQQVSQLFGRIRGKEAGMGKGQSVDLILDRPV